MNHPRYEKRRFYSGEGMLASNRVRLYHRYRFLVTSLITGDARRMPQFKNGLSHKTSLNALKCVRSLSTSVKLSREQKQVTVLRWNKYELGDGWYFKVIRKCTRCSLLTHTKKGIERFRNGLARELYGFTLRAHFHNHNDRKSWYIKWAIYQFKAMWNSLTICYN